ncbi:hypothetical protein ID866_4620 [Astraeus odoratus]|nr:hypothetical protein ID866_4620 [Astraeus odoratus]
MHKHSLSVPLIPSSAPTSPAVTRLSKTERDHVLPATPPRSIRPTKPSSRSPISSASPYSSPYTPLSLRSFPTPSSSTLTTPGSATSLKRFPIMQTPEYEAPLKDTNKSLADAAANWRSRANENGIKVALTADSSFGDDEGNKCQPIKIQGFVIGLPHNPYSRRTDSVRTLIVLQVSSELFDIDENAFEPYPQSFSSAAQSLVLQDPFNGSPLSTIAEVVPQGVCPPYPDMYGNTKPSGPSCLVCGRSGGRLVVLQPCKHTHCDACFTSALNIVGEKDMECAVCKASVVNFAFHLLDHEAIEPLGSSQPSQFPVFFDFAVSPMQQRSSKGDYFCPNDLHAKPLPSLMSTMSLYGDICDQSPGGFPFPALRSENIVLRIDNVPWDITPPAIAAWLKHPVVRVHVLLDQRGKTLSHAYVELATEDIAKAALREVQNSVLGKGKRARGVTVTRSNQEELMRALFPSWKGAFDGSRPSLTGLGPEYLAVVLTTGLITIAELDALMRLIQSPDSHFLKVPTLPFYFLISILSKFPADAESRSYWSGGIRDSLFHLTYTALDFLVARFRDHPQQDDLELLGNFLQASISCQAFTSQQVEMLMNIEAACKTTIATTQMSQNCHFSGTVPVTQDSGRTESTYSALAREFGIDEELVQALAHRLGGLY